MGNLDWIVCGRDRDKRQVVVSVDMNRRLPLNTRISWLAEDLSASKGLCIMHLLDE